MIGGGEAGCVEVEVWGDSEVGVEVECRDDGCVARGGSEDAEHVGDLVVRELVEVAMLRAGGAPGVQDGDAEGFEGLAVGGVARDGGDEGGGEEVAGVGAEEGELGGGVVVEVEV
eukprot:CAMPEP_0184713588 /NCGR_PEP_ID=MMETSP0314-20130426/3907_1 /TAXON_ID=38298 /ORGANISM="Rhodella maculata, Strain CCMP 736" /LENGTH=114 /DNA_ID=CAMNT_0027176281 /DNA_START=307 /DNA_END=652 /DNA_ORIENTATION=-